MTTLIGFKMAFLPIFPLKSMTNLLKERAQLYHFNAQLTSVTHFFVCQINYKFINLALKPLHKSAIYFSSIATLSLSPNEP